MAAGAPDSRPLLQDFDSNASRRKSTADLFPRSFEDGNQSDLDEDESVTLQTGLWKRLRMAVRQRNGVRDEEEVQNVKLPGDNSRKAKKLRLRRRLAVKACVVVPLLVLIILGILYVLNIFLGHIPIFLDGAPPFDWTLPGKDLLDITQDVTPIPCHSHNDYWRRVPLYDALRWGCTGVEADVWLYDDELLVGHSINALTPDRTFRSMYVDPLANMLDHKNAISERESSSNSKTGIYPVDPSQTVVLLVDFKNNGRDIFPVVSEHLAALREKNYLTYYNGTTTIPGPITVVATGNAPFDLITANTTYRDIFFDAPLDRLSDTPAPADGRPLRNGQGTVGTLPSSHFDVTNSYYASINFGRSIGWLWFGHISSSQMARIREQIANAHARGLQARYWSAPKWPIGLRNKVWAMLIEEGVGYLNGDDLQGMARLDWSRRKGKEGSSL